MKRQAIISLSVLIGVFMTFGVPSVYADVVYSQNEDNSVTRELDAGTAYYLIGTFTQPETYQVANGSICYFGISLRSDFNPSTSGQIFIASTTNPTEGSLTSVSGLCASPQIETVAGGSIPFVEATTTMATQSTLIGGHTYGIYTGNGSGFYNGDIKVLTNIGETDFYGYFSINAEIPFFEADGARTRFVLFDPADEEVVATGTPVSLSGYLYINQVDIGDEILTDGWWIEARIRRDRDNQIAVSNITLLDTVLRIDDTFTATYNSFSTTTEFEREGRYTISWTLHRPSWVTSISSFFGLEAYFNAGIVAQETMHIVAGELTAYDTLVDSYVSTIEDSYASTTLSTLTTRLATCNPLGSFSMADCLIGLFTLDPQSSETVTNQFRSLIATKAPLGYVTRLVSIFTTETATSSLPTISFTFPDSLPLGGEVMTFDFNEILVDAKEIASSTLVSSNDPDSNIWTILMPIINTLIYIILFIAIFSDITNMYKERKQ